MRLRKPGCTVMNNKDFPAGPVETPPVLTAVASRPNKGASPSVIKRLLAYNPFYLTSAALLLYGLYRISVDPSFVNREVAQLCFNLSSLEIYEALVVFTAILLAARAIRYDSNLLVGLENLLVLVPFILISQAALIDQHIVWLVSIACGLLALARTGSLQHWNGHFKYPKRLLGLGAIVLLFNIALPIAYRVLHESKFGTKPDWGAAYETNRFIWWLGLPLLCALFEGAPVTAASNAPSFARRFVWHGLYILWLAGTVVHLYCLGYIYDFTLRPEYAAPAAWVMSWIAARRILDSISHLKAEWQHAILVFPVLATLFALPQSSEGVFLVLSGLNVLAYAALLFSGRIHSKLVLHFCAASILAFLCALPSHIFETWFGANGHLKLAGGITVAYILYWIGLSRNPKIGLLGALLVAAATAMLIGQGQSVPHWAAQAGLAFLLVHSLRWRDSEEPGAVAVRRLAALFWIGHSLVWTQSGGAFWMLLCIAGPVLLIALIHRIFSGDFGPMITPLAAIVVLLCSPGDLVVSKAHTAPLGLIAIVCSFGLFAVGTVSALTKHRWHKE